MSHTEQVNDSLQRPTSGPPGMTASHSQQQVEAAINTLFSGNDAVSRVKRDVAQHLNNNGPSRIPPRLPAVMRYKSQRTVSDPPRVLNVLQEAQKYFSIESLGPKNFVLSLITPAVLEAAARLELPNTEEQPSAFQLPTVTQRTAALRHFLQDETDNDAVSNAPACPLPSAAASQAFSFIQREHDRNRRISTVSAVRLLAVPAAMSAAPEVHDNTESAGPSAAAPAASSNSRCSKRPRVQIESCQQSGFYAFPRGYPLTGGLCNPTDTDTTT